MNCDISKVKSETFSLRLDEMAKRINLRGCRNSFPSVPAHFCSFTNNLNFKNKFSNPADAAEPRAWASGGRRRDGGGMVLRSHGRTRRGSKVAGLNFTQNLNAMVLRSHGRTRRGSKVAGLNFQVTSYPELKCQSHSTN